MSDSVLFFDLPLLVSLVVVVVVFITYRIKNKFLLWALILLPPLLMIPLCRINVDLMTSILWTPVYVAVLWSVISIIINIRRLYRRDAQVSPPFKNIKIRFVRPVLTIIIFLGVRTVVSMSILSADKYAIETAKAIQNRVVAEGSCPRKIEGWSDGSHESVASECFYGKYGTKYPVRYRISDDGKDFSISVRHNIDEGFIVTGGVNKQLIYRPR
jgi:hypothetical protein